MRHGAPVCIRVRTGFTLSELVVAMTVAGVMLAIVTGIAVKQQRVLADLADDAALGAQLQDARAIVPAELRAIATAAGDVRDARDTAVEFRSVIANAVVCDTTASSLVLAPVATTVTTLASIAQPIEANDTAWVLSLDDSGPTWMPARVTGVGTAAPGACPSPAPALDATQRSLARVSLTLSTRPSSPLGMPVRVTRPVRYSLYKASDNDWYVGQRDWNNSSLRLNTIQPVAGPFLSAAQSGLRFTYLDTTGTVLSTPVADSRAIALIRVDVRGETQHVHRALGAAGVAARARDSATAFVFMRNR